MARIVLRSFAVAEDLGQMPASTHGDEVRDSLRRIARILLDTPTFWRRNKLSAQLRRELESLLPRIDSIDPGSACDYAFAFSELSRHMPDDIGCVYRGDLADMVARTIDQAIHPFHSRKPSASGSVNL